MLGAFRVGSVTIRSMSESLPQPAQGAAAKTVVIGAGLAGLSCAVRLHEAGHGVVVLEASDGIGGRVRTDKVDGFLLDRGFQVYLDAYPVTGDFLDLPALDLQPFDPGALVWKKGKLREVMDVFRRPGSLIQSGLQPIGGVFDKLLVAKLRWQLMRKSVDEIWRSPETDTFTYLRNFGFSERMIDDFFRSFYGGIFLENQLSTSSRVFEFTFKMFALGSATLPAGGMQAIPDQLVSRLPEGTIQLHSAVKRIDGTEIHCGDQIFHPETVIVATDGERALGLLPQKVEQSPEWHSTTCCYFAADESPIRQPIIALQGDRKGLINNVCVPSEIAAGYAPEEKSLISVTMLGHDSHSDTSSPDFIEAVLKDLQDWFGDQVLDWSLLRCETIRKALPRKTPGHDPQEAERQESPVFYCGDFTTSGSIEGAILSGLRAADQILERSISE